MRHLLLVLTFCLLPAFATAQPEEGNPIRVSVRPLQITVRVDNTHDTPIQCQGRITGVRADDTEKTSGIITLVVAPGEEEHALMAGEYDDSPFVTGSAEFSCRTVKSK